MKVIARQVALLSKFKARHILYWCNGSTLPGKEEGSVRYPA